MKNLFHLLALTAFVAVNACSSEECTTLEPDNEEFDIFGVAKWDNPEAFIVKRHYTLVDTFTVKRPDVSVVVKVTGEVDTAVEWTIDGAQYGSLNVDETSNSTDGLIIKSYFPLVDNTFEYTDGMKIEALVTVGDDIVERQAAITEERFESDLFGVMFGMDSAAVRQSLESVHGVTRFSMRNDSTGADPVTPHFISMRNGITLYIFEEGGLAEVAEFPGSIWEIPEEEPVNSSIPFVLSNSFIRFCERLGFEGEIEVNDNGILAGQYEWERQGIIYRVHMRDDVFPVEEPDQSRRAASRNGEPSDEGAQDEGPLYIPNSIGISYTQSPDS